MTNLACWINSRGFETAEKRDETLDSLIRGRFDTAILFGPEFEGYPGYGDAQAFNTFSQMVRDAGLSVHVWLNCSRLSSYPNFTDVSTQEEYARWVAAVIAEYNPDGIHLDYIRYDVSTMPTVLMEAIATTVQLVHDAIGDKQLSVSQFPLNAAWEERYKDPPDWPYPVPEWFKQWYADNPGSIYDGAISSSGLYVGIPRYMRYQQNGLEWSTDMVIPMEYTSNPDTLKQHIDLWYSHYLASGYNGELVMGIQTRPNADLTETSGLLPDELVECVLYAHELGIGACLFQIGSWNDEQFIAALADIPIPEEDMMAVITNMQTRITALTETTAELQAISARLTEMAETITADIAELLQLDQQLDNLANVIEET